MKNIFFHEKHFLPWKSTDFSKNQIELSNWGKKTLEIREEFRKGLWALRISNGKFYTSGHDYLVTERGNCLMNTHWNTVWSNGHHRALSLWFFYSVLWLRVERGLQFSILWQFHVSRSGVESQSRQCFCDVNRNENSYQSINQSIKLFRKIFSIDWPLRKFGRRKKSEKIATTGIRTPDLETENWNCHGTRSNHAVEEKSIAVDVGMIRFLNFFFFLGLMREISRGFDGFRNAFLGKKIIRLQKLST